MLGVASADMPGSSGSDSAEPSLLEPDDPPPVTVINAGGGGSLLLICDHASNAIPRALGDLGLPAGEIERHIGWDIGAAAVTHLLAQRFDAPAVLSGYSRLVIDCNRDLHHPSSIPTISDGTVVVGNQELESRDKARRAHACFLPYQAAIEAALDRFAERQIAPAIVSIHSFTPTMAGVDRPWHIGVLWDKDPRLPVPLIANLARQPGLVVGDNQPYTAREPTGFTLRYHAVPRGLPHVLIEIRQNEIDTDEGVARQADHLARALEPILADPELYRPAIYL